MLPQSLPVAAAIQWPGQRGATQGGAQGGAVRGALPLLSLLLLQRAHAPSAPPLHAQLLPAPLPLLHP